MARSFDLVDEKVFEADFFLEKMQEIDANMAEMRFYFSAFVSAARSVTFAMQAVLAGVEGFSDWYKERQEELKSNELASYFVNVRNESQHLGVNPIAKGSILQGNILYYFSDAPFQFDVVAASEEYIKLLVNILYGCYKKFGPDIDPEQYYTVKNLAKLNLSLEDIEEELGFPRGWTDIDSSNDEIRLQALSNTMPKTQIDTIFQKYLGYGRKI